MTQAPDSITWNSETFAQNQNANAIRWGTLYNFRFDADQPPQNANATVDFFKTGSPMIVAIQGPQEAAHQRQQRRPPLLRPLQPHPRLLPTADRYATHLAQHPLPLRGRLRHQGLARSRDLAQLRRRVRSLHHWWNGRPREINA